MIIYNFLICNHIVCVYLKFQANNFEGAQVVLNVEAALNLNA